MHTNNFNKPKVPPLKIPSLNLGSLPSQPEGQKVEASSE